MDTVNIKLESLTDNTLIVREGQALELKEPIKISIVGDIKTVANYLKVRQTSGTGLQVIDKSKAVITIDKVNADIYLELDPENYYGTSVHGILKRSFELRQFHINEKHYFSKKELVDLLKFSKVYFASSDKHADMLLAFQKLSSSVNVSARDSSDDRGNKERDFIKTVETNAPTDFELYVPLFVGFEPVSFKVNVCLDVIEGSARFWFESVQLHELLIKEIDRIFADQLKEFNGFVIVNK